MKKLILTILFILFVAVKVNAQTDFKPFKMIFLPDTHVSFDKEDDWVMYKESFVILQDVLKNIKLIPDLNFIVFGGDLIENSDNKLEDFPFFLDSVSDTETKYYAILGDRDADLTGDYTKQHFCAEFRRHGFENTDLTYWTQEPVDNVLLIGLDTSIKNRFDGEIPEEQLAWLDNVLKNNRNKFTIIVMHHPAINFSPKNKTAGAKFVLKNPEEFLNLVSNYPRVKLILSGHSHHQAVQHLNRKLFISAPSIATYPNTYQILTIYPDRVEIKSEQTSFKQIVKKAKKILPQTQYAKELYPKKPRKILRFQESGKFRRFKQKKIFSFYTDSNK